MKLEIILKLSKPIWENNLLLKVKDLVVHYGKAIALHRVSLEVAEGSVVSLVGANGAGKTTVLRALSGLIPMTSGEIWFRDKNNIRCLSRKYRQICSLRLY